MKIANDGKSWRSGGIVLWSSSSEEKTNDKANGHKGPKHGQSQSHLSSH